MEDKIILKPRKKHNYSANNKKNYDLIIVGAGVTGYAAAMYAGRLGLSVLVIGELKGGTITKTEIVENYPGIISITGQDLAKLLEDHAKDYEINELDARVEKIEKTKKGFSVLADKKTYKSKTILIATGTKIKKLGISGESEFENKGVSYCALCDGPFFKDKTIAVIGGSDSAIKESLLLTEFAKKVYIIYRGEKVHPEPHNLKKLEEKIKKDKIEVIKNTNVLEIKGEKIIQKVVLDNPYKNKKELSLEGLFIYIGNTPLSELVKPLKVKLNKRGEIIINKNSETNIKGLYAAGDVTDTDWKQAITGVAEGVKAAYYAYELISNQK